MHFVNKSDQGFTIIEVMITTAILSMGLLAVANMQITSMNISTKSQKLTKATMVSQEQMEALLTLPFNDLLLMDQTPRDIYTTYHAQNPPEGYIVRWDVDTDDGNDADSTNDTKTVKVVTSWMTETGQKSISFPMHLSQYSNQKISPPPEN